jgi:hypothetical protein
MDESKSSRFMWLNSLLFGNDPNYTVLIQAGTAAFGVYSGYSLYVLWWEESLKGESGWTFALALFAVAVMSFSFEILRSAIEGKSEPWSRVRVVGTLVMLATFELFIIAVHGVLVVSGKTFVGSAGFILSEQFADPAGPVANGPALGMLWVVVPWTIVFRLRRYARTPSSQDVHGKKPGYRRLSYDEIKWASAICGLLESKI